MLFWKQFICLSVWARSCCDLHRDCDRYLRGRSTRVEGIWVGQRKTPPSPPPPTTTTTNATKKHHNNATRTASKTPQIHENCITCTTSTHSSQAHWPTDKHYNITCTEGLLSLTRPSTKDPLDAPRSTRNAPNDLSTTRRACDRLTEGCAITTSLSASLPE